MARKKLRKVSVIVRGRVFSDHHYEGMCLGGLIGFALGVAGMWGFALIQGAV